MTSLSAGRLPTLPWHGVRDHRGTEQGKLGIMDVF